MMSHAGFSVLLLAGCSGLTDRLGISGSDSVPWEEQVVELTQGDLAALQSVRFTNALNGQTLFPSVVQLQVRLFDGEGATSVDVLLSERGVSALQRMTAAEQTVQMNALHGVVLSAIHAEAQGTGWYDNKIAGVNPLDEWVMARTAEDLVLSVGFTVGQDVNTIYGVMHLYAVVYGDHVEFDPRAPKAMASPSSRGGGSASSGASSVSSSASKSTSKKKSGKGFFDSVKQGVEMAKEAKATYDELSGN